MQRKLGRLSNGPAEEKHRDRRLESFQSRQPGLREDVRVVEIAALQIDHENAEREADVADSRDDEGLLRCCRRAGLWIIKSDQQIAAKSDQFPPDVEQ